MNAYFVTATGTDIGKTFVTAGLVRHWRAGGIAARAIKPVMSGYDPGAASDASELIEAMGEGCIEDIAPFRFNAPLSPDMAAAREGRRIDMDVLIAFCRRETARAQDAPLLIEGVGGVMVPLDGGATVRDWIAALDLPVVLVAGTYLGTLSHTLTAIEALRGAGARIAALVLNESVDAPVSAAETASVLARFHPGLPVEIIPRGAGAADFAGLAALLRA